MEKPKLKKGDTILVNGKPEKVYDSLDSQPDIVWIEDKNSFFDIRQVHVDDITWPDDIPKTT